LALSGVDMISGDLKYMIYRLLLVESLEMFRCYHVGESDMERDKMKRLSFKST
jgi:hypothetical protein